MYININLLVNIYAPLHGLTHAETCVYLNRVHFAGRPISPTAFSSRPLSQAADIGQRRRFFVSNSSQVSTRNVPSNMVQSICPIPLRWRQQKTIVGTL